MVIKRNENDDDNAHDFVAAANSTKSSKSTRSSAKGSTADKSKKKSNQSAVTPQITKATTPIGPVILGIGTIDLLNVFLGNNEPVQSVLLKQYPPFFDDRMMTISKSPVINIKISLDDECICRSVCSLTVESIFNIPDVLGPELVYKIQIPFPSAAADNESIHLESMKYKTEKCKHQKKLWPILNETDPAILETCCWISDCAEDVKNSLNIDLQNIWDSYEPRIEFNMIKRVLLNAENSMFFKNQLSEFRKLPVEIFIEKPREVPAHTQNAETNIVAKAEKDKSGKKDKKTDKKSKKEQISDKTAIPPDPGEREPKTDYLHFMGYIDVSRLLYPGGHKTRVMVPLRTFHYDEFKKEVGKDDSFFVPKPKPPAPIPVQATAETKKSNSKSAKSDSKNKVSKKASKKSSSNKSNKSKTKDKGSKQKVSKGAMKDKLPPPPVVLPPSQQIYNEAGQITFMIVEVELNDSLYPPRDLEDLTHRLHELIPPQPSLPKKVISSRISQEIFRETIRSLTTDMIQQYQQYKEDSHRTKIPARTRNKVLDDFMKYIKNAGVYETYLASVNRTAASLANEYFSYTGTTSAQYQRFISEIYIYLITEVNKELNMAIVKPMPKQIKNDIISLLYYAKEAIELKDYALADRYLLQRICSNERNGKYWFDYAILYMSMNQYEDAFECCREALVLDTNDYHSLLLYAMLLERKNRRAEAETCMLTIVLNNSTWVEGWGALQILYQQHGNREGMEMSEEMGHKTIITGPQGDSYMGEDDFAWTTKIMPNSLFYRTASLFIKMRLLDEAEMALSNEIASDPGVKEYFLAVICYYRQDYCHCEKHINEAKRLHGSDYAVGSLRGHCYMHLNREDEAIKEYNQILLSYSRPDDIHMLYMYSAFALDKLRDSDKALQLMLEACKYGGTPLTWMGTGVLFLQKGDFIKAEECLNYANILDNRLAEVWGYLVLININLGAADQADMCYTQAIKNGLTNPNLLEDIKNARKKIQRDDPVA